MYILKALGHAKIKYAFDINVWSFRKTIKLSIRNMEILYKITQIFFPTWNAEGPGSLKNSRGKS